MEIPAAITSKGQVTIPAAVRKALGLRAGDRVVFRVADGRALIQTEDTSDEDTPSVELEKVPDFFDLAGSVHVPGDIDPADWRRQREAAWTSAVHHRV